MKLNTKLLLIITILVVMSGNVFALQWFNNSNTAGLCNSYSAGVCTVTTSKTFNDHVKISEFTKINITGSAYIRVTGPAYNLDIDVTTIVGTGSGKFEIVPSTNQDAGNLTADFTNSYGIKYEGYGGQGSTGSNGYNGGTCQDGGPGGTGAVGKTGARILLTGSKLENSIITLKGGNGGTGGHGGQGGPAPTRNIGGGLSICECGSHDGTNGGPGGRGGNGGRSGNYIINVNNQTNVEVVNTKGAAGSGGIGGTGQTSYQCWQGGGYGGTGGAGSIGTLGNLSISGSPYANNLTMNSEYQIFDFSFSHLLNSELTSTDASMVISATTMDGTELACYENLNVTSTNFLDNNLTTTYNSASYGINIFADNFNHEGNILSAGYIDINTTNGGQLDVVRSTNNRPISVNSESNLTISNIQSTGSVSVEGSDSITIDTSTGGLSVDAPNQITMNQINGGASLTADDVYINGAGGGGGVTVVADYLETQGSFNPGGVNIQTGEFVHNSSTIGGGSVYVETDKLRIHDDFISSGSFMNVTVNNEYDQFDPYWIVRNNGQVYFTYTVNNEGTLQFDQTLTATSILFEWTNDPTKKVEMDWGTGLDINLWEGPPDYLNIRAFDVETNSSLNVFNATVNGTLYQTITGLITTTILNPNATEPINITINAAEYYEKNYTNYVPSVSGDLNATLLWIDWFLITAINDTSNATINTFNATINGFEYYETTNGVIQTNYTQNGVNQNEDLLDILVRSDGYKNELRLAYNTTSQGDFEASMTTGVGTDTIDLDFGPFVETQINGNVFTVYFNVSATRNFTSEFYINGILNQINNHTVPPYQQELSYSVTLPDGDYNFSVKVYDNETIEVSPEALLHVDTTAPTLTEIVGIEPIVYIEDNITGQFNFSDTNLFGYEIKIDGVIVDNDTQLNTTSMIYNLNEAVDSFPVGSHVLNITIYDGHTAQEIPEWDYNIDGLTKSLVYTFPHQDGDDYIKITAVNGLDIASSINTQKQQDRYSFIYERNWFEKMANGNDLNFKVESNKPLVYTEDEIYKGWIVSPELKKWLDFNTQSDNDGYEVTIINDYEIDVKVINVTDDYIVFESIGNLNEQSVAYNFSTFSVNITYTDIVADLSSHTTTMVVNATGGSMWGFDANLYYDNTLQTVTKTQNGEIFTFDSNLIAPAVENVTTVWFNWTLDYGTQSRNFLVNQTVLPISLVDCGAPNATPVLNFIALDEEKNSTDYVTNTTLNLEIDIITNDPSVSKKMNFGFTGGYNYSVCVDNANASFSVNAIMEYYSEGFANRKYYLRDVTLGGTSEPHLVNLYHLNDTKASDIIMTVTDQNTGERVENAYINVLRFYPETGNYRSVEIAKTDELGQTLSKMILADVFYKFIITLDGEIKHDSEVQRLLSATKNFYIIRESNILESAAAIKGIPVSVTCSETTKTCRMTWSDPSGLVGRAKLEVYRLNHLGKTLLSEQSMSAAAGTLVYTIAENVTGNEYVAEGFIKTTTLHSDWGAGQAYLNFRQMISDTFGKSALIPFILLTISIGAALLEIGGTAVIIGSIVAMVGASAIGLLAFNTGFVVSLVICGIILVVKLRSQ